jgi:glutamate--cysteine ligase
VLKPDNGDPRMAILTVRDAKELESLRSQALCSGADKPANKSAKASAPVFEVLLQEGVLTCERVNDSVAEPVVYMMDRYVVGGFYRVHPQRKVDESLNAPGSSFVPLAFAESTHLPQPGVKPGASAPNRFYMYGVIGRLAMLAASYEMEATDPHAEHYD